MFNEEILNYVICLKCGKSLSYENNKLICSSCNEIYRLTYNIPNFYNLENKKPIKYNPKKHIFEHWSDWRKKNYFYIKEALVNLPSSSTILDIGAGPAHFKDLYIGNKYFRTDFNLFEGIDFLTDISKPLPCKSNYFDAVILSNVLEHVSKPLPLIKEIYRILKKNGILIMVTPFIIKIHQEPYDFMRYTEHMYSIFFSEANFSQYTIKSIGNFYNIFNKINYTFYNNIRSLNYTSKIKRLFIKLLLKIIILSTSLLKKIVGYEVFDKMDIKEYPQGYGCTAIK